MEKEIAKQGEVLLYSDDNGKEFVNVVFMEENFWLTQGGMAELFDSSKSNISEHLSHIFEEDELENGIYNEIMLSDDGTKTVYCPVSDCRVDGDTCLEITVVADGEINASILPDTIVWNEEQREKCLHCKWHWT